MLERVPTETRKPVAPYKATPLDQAITVPRSCHRVV